jgi:hypothetical protein
MHRELFRTGLKIFRGPILRSGGRTKLVVVLPGSTVHMYVCTAVLGIEVKKMPDFYFRVH